jgi:hypothetical protein
MLFHEKKYIFYNSCNMWMVKDVKYIFITLKKELVFWVFLDREDTR